MTWKRLMRGPTLDRMNVMIVHCHDLGRHLPIYGVRSVSAPHLESLASESVVFDSAFATAPHCSPSRASIFTGLHPQQTGVLGLAHDPFGWDLAHPEAHIANVLREAGYRTALFGVQHESMAHGSDERVAQRLGFDVLVSGGSADVVTERAQQYLRDTLHSRPFYLQVGYFEPHRMSGPKDPTGTMGFLGDYLTPDQERGVEVPPYIEDTDEARAELAQLQGAIRYVDEAIGRLLSTLAETGQSGSTIVVFTTDHGIAMPGAKCTLRDPGTGVSLIVKVPGSEVWAPQRDSSLVSTIDLVPTLLELVDVPVGHELPGLSLSQSERHDEVFSGITYHSYYDPRRAVRTQSYKLIVNFENAPALMNPTQSWRPRSTPSSLHGADLESSAAVELYDLESDPLERINIAGEQRVEVVQKALAERLWAWMQETGDPLTGTVVSPRHRFVMDQLTSALNV